MMTFIPLSRRLKEEVGRREERKNEPRDQQRLSSTQRIRDRIEGCRGEIQLRERERKGLRGQIIFFSEEEVEIAPNAMQRVALSLSQPLQLFWWMQTYSYYNLIAIALFSLTLDLDRDLESHNLAKRKCHF